MDGERICHAQIDDTTFKIAIDLKAALGQGAHPPDPISNVYLRGAANLNLPLLRLMMAFLQPGRAVLDVGAHIGTFALTAAAQGCRVCAIEAAPGNAALLRESARQNGWSDRVQVIQAAVGNRDGELSFVPYGPWGHVATDKIALARVNVPAIRLDDLLADTGCDCWDFVKMDVEGSEVAVLEGASRSLGGPDAPPILYESNYICLDYYDQTPRDLRGALVELGYAHHYLVRPGRLVAVGADELQAEIVGEYLATKTPLSRLAGWRIDQALSRRELIKMLVVERKRQDPKHRLYLGRALQQAPTDLLAQRSVRRILRCLKADPVTKVRDAVTWYAAPQEGVLTRLLDRVKDRLGV
jgi:FkbM family methyltransferase